MRKLCAVLCVLALAGVANADFTGAYAPSEWSFYAADDGYGSLTTAQMDVYGTDSGYVSYGETYYSIEVPASGTLEFDWSYDSTNSPGYDWSYYSLDGAMTTLTDGFGAVSGSVSLPVTAGQMLKLGVQTMDACCGYGHLTVTNFVPEPASLALLALGGLAVIRRR